MREDTPGPQQRQAELALQARGSMLPGVTHPMGRAGHAACPQAVNSREEACREDRKGRQKAY